VNFDQVRKNLSLWNFEALFHGKKKKTLFCPNLLLNNITVGENTIIMEIIKNLDHYSDVVGVTRLIAGHTSTFHLSLAYVSNPISETVHISLLITTIKKNKIVTFLFNV